MNVKFGVLADLHTDFIHDAKERMAQFLADCKKEQVDFAVQLGDFCPPNQEQMDDKNQILNQISQSEVPFYHVLGNHDMDANTKEEVVSYIGAIDRHCSFEKGGIHFVVLDANFYRIENEYYSYANRNYRGLPPYAKVPVLAPSEREWLAKDLEKAKYPAVIFTHQSLIESRAGIRNAGEFRKVIRKAPKGVLMAVCGHEHVDRLEQKEGVWYYCVNSSSYYWAGSKYKHDTYEERITEQFSKLKNVFPYSRALYAMIEITDDSIRINGQEAQIVGASPQELQFEKYGLTDEITSVIQSRVIDIRRNDE